MCICCQRSYFEGFFIKREITAPKKGAILLSSPPPSLCLSLSLSVCLSLYLFPVAPFLSLLRDIFIYFFAMIKRCMFLYHTSWSGKERRAHLLSYLCRHLLYICVSIPFVFNQNIYKFRVNSVLWALIPPNRVLNNNHLCSAGNNNYLTLDMGRCSSWSCECVWCVCVCGVCVCVCGVCVCVCVWCVCVCMCVWLCVCVCMCVMCVCVCACVRACVHMSVSVCARACACVWGVESGEY